MKYALGYYELMQKVFMHGDEFSKEVAMPILKWRGYLHLRWEPGAAEDVNVALLRYEHETAEDVSVELWIR